MEHVSERGHGRSDHDERQQRIDHGGIDHDKRTVGRQHGEVTVRQVDDAHDTEHQREAGRKKRVKAAQQDSLHDGLEKVHFFSIPKYAAEMSAMARFFPVSDVAP